MASSAPPVIPPFHKVYLISTWVETVLWGFNTLVFSVVCYLIFWKRRDGQNKWILFVTSALLYLCATLNVVASLRQELEAFIFVPPDAPSNYASLYYANQASSLAVIKTTTYTVAILIQDIVLTWRMYVVWGYRWKVIAGPAILETMRFAVALSGVIILAQPGTSPDSIVLKTLSSINWPVELVINISVTAAIASRLWSTGSRVSRAMSQPSRTNTYLRHIFLLVESGALLLGTTISLIVLYNIHAPAALAILDVATQIAPLVAYLVIVRAGFGLTHGLPGSKPSDKSSSSYGIASSANGRVFRMDQLESGARIRADSDAIHITREVVTDAEQGDSVHDYKADRVSV
ncbi:hypothetical protein LXA43DRAFT_1096122 [Ganoderma leucocontextum]|nr:hypothetical protein LXA43DRAFT_1096122 [Ganoderma leucocontextum]